MKLHFQCAALFLDVNYARLIVYNFVSFCTSNETVLKTLISEIRKNVFKRFRGKELDTAKFHLCATCELSGYVQHQL